jgi:DNA-binding CsgD family transcriptional regulator
MTDAIGEELLRKLDLLIRITAIAVLGEKPQKSQIELLGRSGLAAKDIATLVGTTRNTVSVTLSNLRKTDPKTKKNKGK